MTGIIRMGRLTRDPEQRDVNGSTVTKFTVAENSSRKDASGQPYVLFTVCSVWGKSGDNLMKYCKKGDPISVVGEFYQREYIKDGQSRMTNEMSVYDYRFLPKGGRDSSQDSAPASAPAQKGEFVEANIDDDELPF